MPPGKLRVVQSNANGYTQKVGDFCWSGLKSFTAKDPHERRFTLFIFKRNDGFRDLSCFYSVFTGDRDQDNKYIFKVVTKPKVLLRSDFMVHLMSPKAVKFDAVDLVEQYGK